MRYAKIIPNDVVNGKGICTSLFVQGCPFHCHGCFNQETWDFDGGTEMYWGDLGHKLYLALTANGIKRNFSILGGEPLCQENKTHVMFLILYIKNLLPDIQIWLWTGFTLEDLWLKNDSDINIILYTIDVLIDGPYIEAQRDLTLPYRGSTNQRIHYLKEERQQNG